MYGIDISNHQRAIDLNKGKYDFCIIKATEGVGFTDGSFKRYSEQLQSLGKLIGCYHFARPDLHPTTSDMEREADWFTFQVKESGLLDKSILVLDWETEPMDNEDFITAFVTRVESKTGITPFIYGSRSKLNKWIDYWAVKHCPIWTASWPYKDRLPVGGPYKGSLPKTDYDWKIWQYSAFGLYPGLNGNIDLDYTPMTRSEWFGYCTKDKEDISEDMQWAIDNGLIQGYGNGKYGPYDPLLRTQLATILHRYDKMRFGE